MKAMMIEHAGGPKVLQEREWPRTQVCMEWVLIQVKAFGFNRSELNTRLEQSPSVSFPRVFGIECVVEAPGTSLQPGLKVAAIMGGMGREFDGTLSVGMAAIVLARRQGLTILATTRKQHKAAQLRERGIDQVPIDTGQIANDVQRLLPGGVNVVLEQVGLTTPLDSLQATAVKGIVCLI